MNIYITLQRLKNAVKDIKSEWYDGMNDNPSKEGILKYNGACEALDLLVIHFQELNDFAHWKKEKSNATKTN